MNEISPSSIHSDSSMKYSEFSYTRESQFLRDNREYINTTQTKKRSNSMADEEEQKEMSRTNISSNQKFKGDFNGWNFYLDSDQKEHRITDSDGSIKFVLSDTQTGKPKRDMWGYYVQRSHQEREINQNTFMEREEGSLENSAENSSSFIARLMERRNLSPLRDELNIRPNDNIYVESLSDENSNSEQLEEREESKEHIRVENNKDSEEDEYDEFVGQQYPHLDDITEKPGWETDDLSSQPQNNEESKSDNEANCWSLGYSPRIENDENYNLHSKIGEHDYNNNFLLPNTFSPKTRSMNSFTSSSLGIMSPPASTFGINTESQGRSDSNRGSLEEIKQPIEDNKMQPEELKNNQNFNQINHNSEEEVKEGFSSLESKGKSSGNLTMSPLRDLTNIDGPWNWETNKETDLRKAMLKEVLEATPESRKYKGFSPENKLISQDDKSSSLKTSNNFPKSEETSHYFHVEKRDESKEIDSENQNDAMNEYGLDIHTKEEKPNNIRLISNESKEELFTKSGNVSIDKQNSDWDNSNNSQFSPIQKVEEDESSDKMNNSSLDKVPQRDINFKKLNYKKSDLIITKTKKAELKEKENINFNLCKKNKSKSKSKSKKQTKTISSLEKHSSKVNSEYLKIFSTQSWNKILDPVTISIMKDLGKKLDSINKKLTKSRKRSSSKKKKTITKRSPIHKPGKIKDIQAFLPILNKRRSKSPLFYWKGLEDKLKSKRNFLKNLRRRSSFENNWIHQIKYQNLRKKSPFINNHLRSIIPRKIMPKSPKIISVPTIDCNRMLGRDKSVVICLQLKFT